MPTRDRRVDIVVDQQHIAGTLISPGKLLPGVLFVHGWGGSQEQYVARARQVAALGAVCFTFDLRFGNVSPRGVDQFRRAVQKGRPNRGELVERLRGLCRIAGV